MLKKIKERMYIWIILTVIFGGAVIGVSWDVYKWKTFQNVTNSDVSYLKWKFLIDDNKR